MSCSLAEPAVRCVASRPLGEEEFVILALLVATSFRGNATSCELLPLSYIGRRQRRTEVLSGSRPNPKERCGSTSRNASAAKAQR